MIFKRVKIGEEKIVEKFAWIPVKVDENTIVWLEKNKEKWIFKKVKKVDYTGAIVEKERYVRSHRWVEE